MTISSRRTPCVGICSTTYGDLVCRGCKRFAHEIIDWNTYSDDQHARVWQRLNALRDACVDQYVVVVDAQRFDVVIASLRLDLAVPYTRGGLVYELLRRRGRTLATLAEVGLEARTGSDSAGAIRDEIDREFMARSRAAYERSFHTSVDG
ncbi:MAG: DUF1289 domain-containing protein [Gammaproteobacteria bacterium]|nr:DUF1289 domain-containing protein [Gammaproteobacteria bacterium]